MTDAEKKQAIENLRKACEDMVPVLMDAGGTVIVGDTKLPMRLWAAMQIFDSTRVIQVALKVLEENL